MLSIEISGDTELVARLASMPDVVHKALLAKVTELTFRLEALVKQKLSGQVLNVRTGALRSSIFSNINDSGDAVIGSVHAPPDVPYAAIHEFGGMIPERLPVNARALHFFVEGKEVFAKRARAFKMPERSYMRSSLSDLREEIIHGLKDAVVGALRTR